MKKVSFVVPDMASNGYMITSLYPNLKYVIRDGRVVTTIGLAASFDFEWWNAPYKEESENHEEEENRKIDFLEFLVNHINPNEMEKYRTMYESKGYPTEGSEK